MNINPYAKGAASGAYEQGVKTATDYAGVTSQLAAITQNTASVNKWNPAASDFEANTYLATATGLTGAHADYDTSGFIPVTEGQIVLASGYGATPQQLITMRQICGYDANKANVIAARSYNAIYYYIVPAGVSFVRINIGRSVQYPMVEVNATGGNSLSYIAPASLIKVPDDVFVSSPTPMRVDVFLPAEICVAVGRTIEIYNRQVCPQAKPGYHFTWACAKGHSFERKYSVTAEAGDVGNHALVLRIYDDNFVQIGYAVTTLKIVAAYAPSAAKKVLALGDSLSTNKAWLAEMVNLSGTNLEYVGTVPFSVADADSETRTGNSEGHSGWTADNYLASASVSSVANPFWDGTRFNWAYYVTNSLSGVAPNAVQIWLGTNGMIANPAVNANNIKRIIDYIRQDSASMPIYLAMPLYRPSQDGIGVDGGLGASAYIYDFNIRVYNLMRMLYTVLTGYTNLYFIPLPLCHDSEYNYGSVSTPVNPRAAQTVNIPSESTHPQAQGYFQCADIMYSALSAHPV